MPYIESNDRGKAVKCFELHTVDYSNSSPIIISAQQGDTNSRIFEITFRDDKGRLSLSVKMFLKIELNFDEVNFDLSNSRAVNIASYN